MFGMVFNIQIWLKVLILPLLLHLVTLQTEQELKRQGVELTEVPTDISDDWFEIVLSDNFITRIEDGSVYNFTQLRTIWITSNHLTYVSPTAFQNTNLKTLGLGNNQLTAVPDFSVYGGSIERLYLQGNYIVSIPDGTFDGMSYRASIQLTSNLLVEHHIGEFGFSGATRLTPLSFDNNKLRGGIFVCLRNFPQTLKIVYLGGNNLTDTSETLILGSLGQRSILEKIYLQHTCLTTLPDLYHINPSSQLTRLNITEKHIPCDAGMLWLKNIQNDVQVKVDKCEEPAALAGRTFHGLWNEELDPQGEN